MYLFSELKGYCLTVLVKQKISFSVCVKICICHFLSIVLSGKYVRAFFSPRLVCFCYLQRDVTELLYVAEGSSLAEREKREGEVKLGPSRSVQRRMQHARSHSRLKAISALLMKKEKKEKKKLIASKQMCKGLINITTDLSECVCNCMHALCIHSLLLQQTKKQQQL